MGMGYDPIDKWLLQQYSLPPIDREQVRTAVFQGRQVDNPALAPAAHDLAAKVLGGEFRVLRMSTGMQWANVIAAVALAGAGMRLLVTSRLWDWQAALGILGLSGWSMLTFVNGMQARRNKRIHQNAAVAMQLTPASPSRKPKPRVPACRLII